MHPRIVARIEGEGRNLYIDMLRGACILLVMLLHYSLAYRLQTSPLQAWMSVPTLRAIFYNGNYGVDIFFVISGFLITSNMLARYGSLAGIDVMHFYKLRFFRLYPLVVLALAVITVLGLTGFSHFSNIAHQTNLGSGFFLIADLSVLTFWHNLLMESVGYFNYAMNIYWSLSVEEVFYLLYPLVLVMARRRWQLVLLACICAVIAPIYRGIHQDDELFFMYGNLACVDMLAYGCVAAVLVNRVRLTNAPRYLLAALACIAMAWVYMQGIHDHEALGATFLGLAAAIFLVVVSRLSASAAIRRLGAPLAWLGSHSYELYLFHIVVLGIMVELVRRSAMPVTHKLPMLAIFLVLSAALAWATARCFGDPLNQWLRRRYACRDVNALPATSALATDAVRSD
ncbi:acyltransferase family protein [Dyella flava]|uniref:Acyltransferase n=1 Tax=Dyella flava TaxID=1920170 RepID=A0ABS2K0Y3_9GAMM|nr:acyltransferase [Dyella flava]MBM7124912.1 acyltransferase [Dyella flava]GLQ49865.1 acyltransferase [Dyella flava]